MDEIRYWIETEGAGHWFYIAFPIVLLCLFIWFKGRRVRFLIPNLLMSIIIINPLFFKYWDKLGLYAYWRILWVVPVVPVVAGLIPSITERIHKGWLKGVFSAVGVGLVVFGGTFLYNGAGGSFVEAANASKLPDYVVQIADRLLELDEHPRVIAQDPIGVYIRQYTADIDTLYGRDIGGVYISDPNWDARIVHDTLSNSDAEKTEIAQFMLDNEYDYLVYNQNPGMMFEFVDQIEDYGIYKTVGNPTVLKERNDVGQVIAVTTVDTQGNRVNNELGYSTIHREYDEFCNVIREWRTDKDGVLTKFPGGHSIIEQKWDAYGNLTTRTYLDENGIQTNRIDGYAQVIWKYSNGVYAIHFYDVDGIEIPCDGLNLVKDVEVEPKNGWSEWMSPKPYSDMYSFTIGTVNLGERKNGDSYYCQVEVEFKNVTVSENGSFRFVAQGRSDETWENGNIWNGNLVWLGQEPKDGIYSFSCIGTIEESMRDISTFELGFRCDNWKSGSFRVRKVTIKKGNYISEWSPGV